MSYPKQVPPGWSRGDPVQVIVSGPVQCAIGRDLSAFDDWRGITGKEVVITFDSVEDGQAWLKWWKSSATPDGCREGKT